MHAFLRSSGCKWRVILDHFSEIMLDDCGHCSSCTSPIVPQVITDVLHALHEAFCAMEGTHFDKPLWEGSLLHLLMGKQNAKLKSDYPAHARAILWDVGQQFPQLTRADWASALWHGVKAGVLSIEHELSATCASVVYTAGDSTPFNEGAHFMAKLKGQVRPPTTSQEGTHGKVPRFKGNEALDKFFLKLFANYDRLTPAEAISKTTPSGKTAVQEDSMYNN